MTGKNGPKGLFKFKPCCLRPPTDKQGTSHPSKVPRGPTADAKTHQIKKNIYISNAALAYYAGSWIFSSRYYEIVIRLSPAFCSRLKWGKNLHNKSI